MKYSIVLFAALASFSFAACNNAENSETTTDSTAMMTTTPEPEAQPAMAGNYVDMGGRPLTRDEASGRYVDESGAPAEFYIDASAGDTFYGQTGQNVNNALIHEGETWRVDDAKIKIDDDQIKIKTDEGKTKIEDDKMKTKTDDKKVKVIDRDKDGSTKTKVKEK